jgi:hypothetical protein
MLRRKVRLPGAFDLVPICEADAASEPSKKALD